MRQCDRSGKKGRISIEKPWRGCSENLKSPKVSAYIAERLGAQDKKRVADADEVMEFYTAVMRGEVKDQFGLDTALSDRLKAGAELMKRYSAAGTVAVLPVTIIDNIPKEDANV